MIRESRRSRGGWTSALGGMLVVLAGAAVAGAQDQGCRYDGELYPEQSTICQAGLSQTCMNGTWQSLDGARCDEDGGTMRRLRQEQVVDEGDRILRDQQEAIQEGGQNLAVGQGVSAE